MKSKLSFLFLIILFSCANVSKLSAQDSLVNVISKDSAEISVPKNDTLATVPNTTSKGKAKLEPFERQFRVMTDIFYPILSITNTNQYSFEALFDYNFRKDKFLTFAAGYGGSKIDYPNLKYNSNNVYFKLGIDFSMFDAMYKSDWDMVTVGFKYGVGIGQRSAANFSIPNPFGGDTWSEVAAKNFMAHWLDISLGIRFELLPQLYTGWNARFSMNFTSDIFAGQVSPKYMAGFGQSNKSTSFGFNYYIGYAIKWKK